MKKGIVLIALIFFQVQLFAQETTTTSKSYSLKEAIDHAVKNNYSAINANRDYEAAKLKKKETTTMGLPQINGNLGYQNTFAIQQQGIEAQNFNPSAPADAIDVVGFGLKHNMVGTLTLNQLIFDGSYLVGLQSAKTYLKISENAQKKTAQEITELTTTAYGNVLMSEESIKIIERNQQTLEKTLKDTRETYKNGFLEEESVERLQITLTAVKSSYDYANRMKTIATNMLKLLMGIDLDESITLTEKLDALTTSNIDMALLNENFDLQNNIDYQISKNLEDSKRLQLKYEKSKALPSLSAQVNFGYNTFGKEFTMFNANNRWYNFSNLGIGLNVPIFSSFARSSRTAQAKIAFEQAKTKLIETEQTLKLQYQKAKSDYEYSVAQYNSAKSTLRLAERIENKQSIKFKEGLSTSFEFTEAQNQLFSAQQSYLQTMVDIINKRATLQKVINK
ncbi:TolC family protein [Flavobacterium amnicola]|uniref:TolC family protein n=1 Tax=Flavobacterium amnicola TaxID=2506422 RepID=A0A4Q1K5Q6_9FLAO|nr:TolC family protein [Flavobacterium amnicola]RXR20705.1 TolC family protein [Flavobacterium amnicola]